MGRTRYPPDAFLADYLVAFVAAARGQYLAHIIRAMGLSVDLAYSGHLVRVAAFHFQQKMLLHGRLCRSLFCFAGAPALPRRYFSHFLGTLQRLNLALQPRDSDIRVLQRAVLNFG